MSYTAAFPHAPRRKRRIPPAMEWVEDVTGRCARVTAVGSRQLLVENHTGVTAFTQDCIRLDTGLGEICVTGDGLYLCQMRPGALIVRGNIRRVELPCEGGAQRGER